MWVLIHIAMEEYVAKTTNHGEGGRGANGAQTTPKLLKVNYRVNLLAGCRYYQLSNFIIQQLRLLMS